MNSTRAGQEGCSNSLESEMWSIECKLSVTFVQLGGRAIFISLSNSCRMFCAVLSVYEQRGRETTRGDDDDWAGEGKEDLRTERFRDARR